MHLRWGSLVRLRPLGRTQFWILLIEKLRVPACVLLLFRGGALYQAFVVPTPVSPHPSSLLMYLAFEILQVLTVFCLLQLGSASHKGSFLHPQLFFLTSGHNKKAFWVGLGTKPTWLGVGKHYSFLVSHWKRTPVSWLKV